MMVFYNDGIGHIDDQGWMQGDLNTYLESDKETMQLGDPRVAKVTRLRLLSDYGFPMWDVSYCWGVDKQGNKIRIDLPVHQFSKARLKGEIIEMAKSVGVYAKGLGLLDNISKLQ